MARPSPPGVPKPPTGAAAAQDEFSAEVSRAIDFLAVVNGGMGPIIDALDSKDAEFQSIAANLLRSPKRPFPKARIVTLNKESVKAAFEEMEKFGLEVAKNEADYLFNTFGGEEEGMKRLTAKQIREAVKWVEFLGKRTKGHQYALEKFRKELLLDELGTLQQARAAGALIDPSVEIKALQRGRDAMEATVRVYIPAVREAIRQLFYRHNPKARRIFYWSSILDGRTTLICIANDGATRRPGQKAWSNGYAGPYPAHYGERSLILNLSQEMIDALKKRREEKKAEEKPAAGKKSSAAGGRKARRAAAKKKKAAERTVAGQPAEDWFKSLSEAEQKKILGRKYWDLWKKGKLTLQDFLSSRGRKLTLSELSRRHPGAARKAGVA